MSQLITEINEKIESGNRILEQIQSNIKWKVNLTNLNTVIEKKQDEKIIKFIQKINYINDIFKKNKRSTEVILGNLSNNTNLADIYILLSEQIKIKSKADLNEPINGKNILLINLDYPNLSNKIVNLYLINILGKLLCMSISFNLFRKFLSDYESYTGLAASLLYENLINSTIILESLKSIFIINDKPKPDYYLVLKFYTEKNKYLCNHLILEKTYLDELRKIIIKLRTDNNLTFYLILEYTSYEDSFIYPKCNIGLIKYDKDVLKLNPKKSPKLPSNFKIKFSIQDENKNPIKNDIVLDINYYNCKFETTLYSNTHFRYEFVLTIDGIPFYLNPYNSTNIFDNLVIW